MSLARVRRGDTVVVISGKYKGKTGKVLAVNAADERVLVEGINLVKRHVKPTPQQREGGIVEVERPVHLSKVMPIDPETNRGTRVKTKTEADGSKTRIAKSGQEIKAETL